MGQLHAVGHIDEIPEGQGRVFRVGDQTIAVFNDRGQYFATDDRCPHAGASLACGALVDGTVVCTWHAWRFRLLDGAWVDNPKLTISTYRVHVQDDQLQLEV